MKEKKKIRTSMWLDVDTIKECDSNLIISDCKNRSEYITKAIEFYSGFLHSENNSEYLAKTITSTVEAIIANTENRLSRLQFKEAVELAKLSKLISMMLKYDDDIIRQIHIDAVNEVKKINGVIEYRPFGG